MGLSHGERPAQGRVWALPRGAADMIVARDTWHPTHSGGYNPKQRYPSHQ
jgi:hypothetical protein